MIPYRRLSLLTILLLLPALGCGGGGRNPNAPAKILGKVTYKGAPVTGGTIQFHTLGSGVYTATLAQDGSFTATDLPAGDLIVCVETESVKGSSDMAKYGAGAKKMEASPAPAGFATKSGGGTGTYVKIPAKYANPKSSDLTVTLVGGINKKDFDLTD